MSRPQLLLEMETAYDAPACRVAIGREARTLAKLSASYRVIVQPGNCTIGAGLMHGEAMETAAEFLQLMPHKLYADIVGVTGSHRYERKG